MPLTGNQIKCIITLKKLQISEFEHRGNSCGRVNSFLVILKFQ